jgi:HAD superfamily hydrolase (TIGR01509 family)
VIKAVVFDLDGLLVDSEPLAKQSWSAVLVKYGRAMDAATAEATFGLRLDDSARLIQERFGIPAPAQQLAEERHQMVLSMLEELRPMPGLLDMLRAVDDRGLRRAVATSSGSRYAPAALHAVGAADGFAAIITGDMVNQGKPAPDVYLAAANAMQLAPDECLAVEDSPNGVQSACEAGMICVAIPNHLTVRLDLSAAHWRFTSLEVLAANLDSVLAVHGASPAE